jgi:hypothetical protein
MNKLINKQVSKINNYLGWDRQSAVLPILIDLLLTMITCSHHESIMETCILLMNKTIFIVHLKPYFELLFRNLKLQKYDDVRGEHCKDLGIFKPVALTNRNWNYSCLTL